VVLASQTPDALLAGPAGLVRNADLPRQLQQILVDAAMAAYLNDR